MYIQPRWPILQRDGDLTRGLGWPLPPNIVLGRVTNSKGKGTHRSRQAITWRYHHMRHWTHTNEVMGDVTAVWSSRCVTRGTQATLRKLWHVRYISFYILKQSTLTYFLWEKRMIAKKVNHPLYTMKLIIVHFLATQGFPEGIAEDEKWA